MLLGSVLIDNQVPYSVWLTEEHACDAPRLPNAICKAQSKRLRRMQSQNFVQRAAYEVVQLFKGQSEVA